MLVGSGRRACEEDSTSRTVIGPSNIHLHDGAQALLANEGKEGVRLTLLGLKFAQGLREEKTARANLCAGFLLVNQLQTALEHCDSECISPCVCYSEPSEPPVMILPSCDSGILLR